MLDPIRRAVLAATVVLLAPSAAWPQQKGKPAAEEQTGLEVGESARVHP